MKICINCKKQIGLKTVICPYCEFKQIKQNKLTGCLGCMGFIFIGIFFWFFILFSISLFNKNENTEKKQSIKINDIKYIGPGKYIGSKNRDDLYQAYKIINQGDQDAFNQLLYSNKVFLLEQGKKVFVLDREVFNGITKVRYEGQITTFWVLDQSIIDK